MDTMEYLLYSNGEQWLSVHLTLDGSWLTNSAGFKRSEYIQTTYADLKHADTKQHILQEHKKKDSIKHIMVIV